LPGSRDQLFKFWDPLIDLERERLKIQTSSFGCGLIVRNTEPKKMSKRGVALVTWPIFQLLGPIISLELVKVQTSNFARRLKVRDQILNKKGKTGQNESWSRSCATSRSAECLVRTVDSDVICILTGKFHSFQLSVWVAFVTGRKFMHLSINDIIHGLWKDKAEALPVFHAFTTCDCVSSFVEETSALHGKLGVLFQRSQGHFNRSRMSLSAKSLRQSKQLGLSEWVPPSFVLSERQVNGEHPSNSRLLCFSTPGLQYIKLGFEPQLAQEDLPSPETWRWTKYSGTWKLH